MLFTFCVCMQHAATLCSGKILYTLQGYNLVFITNIMAVVVGVAVVAILCFCSFSLCQYLLIKMLSILLSTGFFMTFFPFHFIPSEVFIGFVENIL